MAKKKRDVRKFKQVFTDLLREIAQEETEFVDVPDEEGTVCVNGVTYDKKIVTKAERLARELFKAALGYEVVTKGKHGDVVEYIPPDKWAIGLLFDRLEGKAGTVNAADKRTTASVAERVSEVSVKALNKMANDANSQ